MADPQAHEEAKQDPKPELKGGDRLGLPSLKRN
jgi:hypothetical protein